MVLEREKKSEEQRNDYKTRVGRWGGECHQLISDKLAAREITSKIYAALLG